MMVDGDAEERVEGEEEEEREVKEVLLSLK